MTMIKDFPLIPCPVCLEEIEKIDTAAAMMWTDLVNIRCQSAYVEIAADNEPPPLVVLEHMGYVNSTERTKSILIRIKGGSVLTRNKFYLCAKLAKHLEKLHSVQEEKTD